MMSKGEIAAYLGMANVMMSAAIQNTEDDNDIMVKVREALLQAQIYMTQDALREVMDYDSGRKKE